MIRDVLIPALIANFSNRGFRSVAANPATIGVFPAAHPDIGDVTICDDGQEVTIYIGDLTHGHFDAYDNSLTERQVAERVTEDVVAFLNDLFADQVLVWKSRDNCSDGWRRLGHDSEHFLGGNVLTYLWSGPVPNPDIIDAG